MMLAPRLCARLLVQFAVVSASAAGEGRASFSGRYGRRHPIGLAARGALDERDAGNAFSTPMPCFRRPGGSDGVFPRIMTDRTKPGMIAVNQAGMRLTDKAVSYHAFVQAIVALIALLVACLCHPSAAEAASRKETPHYELALNADNHVCPEVLDLYNRLLIEVLDGRLHSPSWYYGFDETNFSVTQGQRFARIGLMAPRLVMEGRQAYPAKFYSVVLGPNQRPRALALQDVAHGHEPVTFIAILKDGIAPRFGTGWESPPVQAGDVDQWISVNALADSQERAVAHLPGAYLLTRWPEFSRLFAEFGSASKSRELSARLPLPAVGGGGVTIRPFQGKYETLYFIIDQHLPISRVKQLQETSDDESLVVVQRLSHEGLDDLCYLVLAPGRPAATVEFYRGQR
jgi:hypothetical protein